MFGLCIDKLEGIVNNVAKEGLLGPKLMQELIFIVIFANDYVLPSFNVDAMQHLLGVVETFCQNKMVSNNY